MRPFKLTPEADADIADIHAHVFDQDAATAALVVDRIEETIETVCVFPQVGKPTPIPDVWVFGGKPKSPFRITYQFDDEQVIVVRVFRASRERIQL